jgi:GTP-binding protein
LKKQGLDDVARLLWDWTHGEYAAQPPQASVVEDEEEPPALD